MTEAQARSELRVIGCGLLALPGGRLAVTHSRRLAAGRTERADVAVGEFDPAARRWSWPDGSWLDCNDLAAAVAVARQAVFAAAGRCCEPHYNRPAPPPRQAGPRAKSVATGRSGGGRRVIRHSGPLKG